MDYIAQPKDYWIAQGAIAITLNALGNPNRIQGSVASGAAILCYIEGVDGLGYDNGHRFKTWPLSLSPTYFNSNTPKYVYAAIPRTSSIGTQAVVVFPSEKLDVYGKNSDGAQVGSSDYYYIWLQGIISSSGDYGTTNRTWTAEMDFGKKGTDEDLYDDTDGEWYQYSKVSGLVTFLKNIQMKAGTTFHNLFLGYKELTGVATGATSEEYVDSETLVVTPSYLQGKYLSRQKEDTAQEQIGFLKGLWVGIQGLYEITAEGIAKFKSLFVDDITAQRMQVDDMQSSNYTGDGIADTGWRLTKDYNGHSKLTIDELYVRMKAVFEALEVKKELVSGGNEVQSCAASVISKVDYLDASKDILGYDEYKVPFTLRNAIVMLAKGQNPFGSYSRTRKVRLQLTAADRQNVRYVRCYFLAKEGDRKIQNWWRVADPNDDTTGNDMARCQTFNLASDSVSERDTYWGGSTTKIGNIFWWRKLAGVSTTPVEIDGKMYHYFDVYCNPTAEAATPYTYAGAMQGSDIPAPGDEVSQWGNDNNIDRMNLIVHEVNGQDAAIKMYEGINQFSMETGLYGNPLKIRFAPKTGCKVNTTKWEVVTDSFIAPIPVECGNWTAGTVAKYYEIYQHNGGSWLCVASNGGTFKVIEAFGTYSVGDTITQTAYDALTVSQQMCCARVSFGTTTDEPSTTSAAWRQYAAKGEKGDNAIRIDIDNEYDSIQYQGDGTTKVSPSGTVQTTAYLFDGITDKSSDATFTISNRSGMSDQQATISGRVVTVSGLTSDGEVTIRAEYPASSGKYYYTKFTVKKLIGIDKYDLVVTPNAVPVNTSNTVPDTTINVQVYRTPANGGTRHLVEFTNKTTNDYGLTLSVKDSLNNTLTETTGTGTVTTRTFNLTGTMATNADNVMVVLTKDSTTQDAETIPITRVQNGAPGSGANAVKIDLDNEMDSIPCDSDGKVMSQTVLEVNARIYDGAAPVTSGVAVGSVGAIAGVSAVTSISNGVVNIKWTIPATGSGTPLSVDKYTSQIVLTCGGNSYYATFTANVVKSGEPGVSPTILQLLPSPSQISFKRDSSGSIPSSTQTLSLSIKKSDENGTSVITVAASGLTVRYRTDQAPSSASDGTAWPAAGLSVSSSVTYGNVYIAAFDSNGTLVDRETVAIVKDGEKGAKGSNGDNAIRIDIDNEYDSIQYQGDGTTKVSPSGTIQTTAYLFDGITDKSSDATFTISNRSGMSDQQATISGRVVTVSGLTSDGEVTIRAEYPANSGKYYYAKFTVKKLIGIDKYDLVVTPNAVPVNTSNTVADTTINVQVYRTPANGGTRHLVEFTNKTTNDYGLTLSVKDSLNNNLTETTGTGTVTTRTFNLTGTMATNADNVMVVLTKDSKTQDAETVPITHVHNGIDGSGSNAVKIDLDNELDSIPCDSDGKVMSQTVLEVNARIYDGAAPVTSGVAVSSVGAIAGVSAVTSISNGVVNIKWTIPATGSGTPLSVDKYTSQIVLTWGGNSYYATFTANVVKSGEPGVSPTILQLLPSPSQISFKRDSSGSIPSSTQTLSLSIKKSDENGTSVITVAASGLTVRYRTDQAPSSVSDGTAWPAAGLSVSSSVTYGNVYIAAFDSNGTLVDRETVAIVKDGEKGATGQQGIQGPQGDDGEDAVNIVISPASLIVNQDLQSPNNLSNLTQTFVVRVYKGDVEQTVGGLSFVAEVASTTPTTAYKCLFLNGGGQRSGNSNIAGNVLTLKQINTYQQDGKTLYYDSMFVDVTATYNTNKTITARVRIYANLLGTWSEEVVGDAKTEVAKSLSYAYDSSGQNVVSLENMGKFIKSSTQDTSELRQKVYVDILNLTYPATSSSIDGMTVNVLAGTYKVAGEFNLANLPTGNGYLTFEGPGVNKTWDLTGGLVDSIDDEVTFTSAGVLTISAGDDVGSGSDYNISNLAIYQSQDKIAKLELTADGLTSDVNAIKAGKNLFSGALTGAGWYSESSVPYDNHPQSQVSVDSNGYMNVLSGGNLICKSVTIERNVYYTLSLFGKVTSSFQVGVWITASSAAGWQQLTSISFDAVSSTATRRVKKFKLSGSGTVTVLLSIPLAAIRYPQIELGEEATDFVSGDMEVNSRIKQTADEIDLSVKNDYQQAGLKIVSSGLQLRGGKVDFTDSNGIPYIKVSVVNGIPHFIFLDPNGNEMYDLGYTGLRQLINNGKSDEYDAMQFVCFLVNNSAAPGEDGDYINGKALYGDSYSGVNNPMTDLPVWFFTEGFTIGSGGQRIYNWGGLYVDGVYLSNDTPTQLVPGQFVDDGWYFIYTNTTNERMRHFRLIEVLDGAVTYNADAQVYKFLGNMSDLMFSDKPSDFTAGYRCQITDANGYSSVGYVDSGGNLVGNNWATIPTTT